MRKTLAVLALAALSGCASNKLMDEVMLSWQGTTADDVIRQWGYPQGERTVAGRKLLVWERNVTLNMPVTASTTGTLNQAGGTAYYQGQTTYGGGRSDWSCTRTLEVDAGNRVVGYEWGGNNCPFTESGPYANWRRK